MERVPGYKDIRPPKRAIRTNPIPKPEPEIDPLDVLETEMLDTSGVGHGIDRAVLFSGGDDSLALTHLAMEQGWANLVVHLATNSEVPANIDYVRRVCEEYCWPLMILESPMDLPIFGYRYGFPGSSCHTMAYNYFKGRQLGYFAQHRPGDVKFFSGVRKLESDRRMENIDAEVEYEDPDEGNFKGWWLSPLIDKSDEWVARYRDEHGLPRNPVAKNLHRSGDCHCLAFGHRDEELTLLQAEYPDFADWLLNIERRVQEYRGRVALLEEEYRDIAEDVAEQRKAERPHPMKLTVLLDSHPEIYQEIVAIPPDDAIAQGRLEPTNYLGHGGLSSQELRSKVAESDMNQQTLCETCQQPATRIARSVRHRIKDAQEAVSESLHQTTLGPNSRFDCGQ